MSKYKTFEDNTKNWHRADIIAALHKCGWSLRQLAFANGYKSGTNLKAALDAPFPKGEKIIADALGLTPKDIWPERVAHRNLKKIAKQYHSQAN